MKAKFFLSFFFLASFLTPVLASKLNSAQTLLLPERESAPIVINVIVPESCHPRVVYYSIPGITAGGMAFGGGSSVAGAGSGFVGAFSSALSFAGAGGVFGTNGWMFPMTTGCYWKGERNE